VLVSLFVSVRRLRALMTVLSQSSGPAASQCFTQKNETFVALYVENFAETRIPRSLYADLRVILRFPHMNIRRKLIERWAYDWPLSRDFDGAGGWG